MKQECLHRCIKAYASMQETPIISTIKDFECAVADESDLQELQQFYDYLKLRYKIPCETGMLFVEKVTMANVFEKLKAKASHMNSLVNKKMMLYHWIRPSHLDIQELSFEEAIESLRKICTTEVPSVKIHHLMTSIKTIHKKIGADTGHDGLFPCLVYCLIRSEIQDLHIHVSLMRICRRSFDQECSLGCTHGFQAGVSCNCLFSEDWGGEDRYYITVTQAAVEYISKIEFCNLSIGVAEFDGEIAKRLNKIDLKSKADGPAGTG